MGDATVGYAPLTEKDFYDLAIQYKRNLVATEGSKWTAETPVDPGVALIRVDAHIAALLAKYIDTRVTQNYLIYATSSEAVHATCRQIGYTKSGAKPAYLRVKVVTTGVVNIPAGAALIKEVATGEEIRFETIAPIIATSATTKYVYAVQGTVKSTNVVGTGKAFQEIKISNYPVADNRITVAIGGTVWTKVTDFVFSTEFSKHYVVEYDYKGQPTIVFGDGNFGIAPPNGADIFVSYLLTDGYIGNVAPGEMSFVTSYKNIDTVENASPTEAELVGDIELTAVEIEVINNGSINSFLPTGIAYIEEDSFSYTSIVDNKFLGVTGLTQGHPEGAKVVYSLTNTYGVDRETSAKAKISALNKNRLKTSCNSLRDYEYVLSRLSGVARVRATANYNNVDIQVVPTDGGLLSTALETALYAVIGVRKNALHSVSLSSPNYVFIDVTIEIAAASGYSYDEVKSSVVDLITAYLSPLNKNSIGNFSNNWGNKLKKNLLEANVFAIGNGYKIGDAEITVFKRSSELEGNDNIQLNNDELVNVGIITVLNKNATDTSVEVVIGDGEGSSAAITVPKMNAVIV